MSDPGRRSSRGARPKGCCSASGLALARPEPRGEFADGEELRWRVSERADASCPCAAPGWDAAEPPGTKVEMRAGPRALPALALAGLGLRLGAKEGRRDGCDAAAGVLLPVPLAMPGRAA